uniref:Uncharacterized protein n=1 Tax=Ananas comosus var. bracteatus TaxID=296719 RepID=A0A6V7NIY6_ANACO|nr:unnamed protein product [Ananas comosus var. bracteatus]
MTYSWIEVPDSGYRTVGLAYQYASSSTEAIGSLSSPLTLIFSPSHSFHTSRERKEGEEGEEEEKELAWRPWSTIFFLISRLWRLGACFWSFVEDQTSTLLGFELGLKLLLRLDWKDSSSHLEIERASFAIGLVHKPDECFRCVLGAQHVFYPMW